MTAQTYRKIADDLRSAITRGDYQPGDTLPTRKELMDRYHASTTTVRQAVALLRAEGLVVPIRRRGTVVRDRTPVRLSVTRYADVLASPGDRGPWETACDHQQVPARTEVISVDSTTAPADVARELGLDQGATVIRRIQHMYAGSQIAQIQITWLPAALANGTPLASPAKVIGGIYRALAALGHPPATAHESVVSRMPDPNEAATLSLGQGSPVLAVDRTTHGRDGHALVTAHAVIAGDRVSLFYAQTFPPS